MLIDLFGRGWSDGVPDLPYDGRLYASQVFMALASSPIAWTGDDSGGFALVGYSLGGCLAADFTSWFPERVKELVLIAPAGLQRESDLTWQTRLIYSGWLPESWAEAAVRRRLRTMPNVTGKQRTASKATETSSGRREAEAATSAELPEDAVIATSRGEIDIEAAVNWQMDNHAGFMPAFMSSIRHAPIRNQQHSWRLIGSRLDEQRALNHGATISEVAETHKQEVRRRGLKTGKVLLIFGANDGIIKPSETGPDAREALGVDNVIEKVYANAGHEVPITCRDEIADLMWQHWSSL
ncbi:MAG: hypothetical protein Q9162_001163 [Coniocarpon cinnabarinum]